MVPVPGTAEERGRGEAAPAGSGVTTALRDLQHPGGSGKALLVDHDFADS